MGNYYLTEPDYVHVEERAFEAARLTGEDQVLHVHKFKDECDGHKHIIYRPDGTSVDMITLEDLGRAMKDGRL